MLIDFTVKNFLSFRNETSFSMLAAKSVKEHGDEDANIMYTHSEDPLLKVAAIYGANGSGKSNLLAAMGFFKTMVMDSFKNDSLLHNFSSRNFQFDVKTLSEPSDFEMMFLLENKRYRYGFEISEDSVVAEWLFVKPSDSSRESYCFKREKKDISVNSKTYKGAGGIAPKTRHDALFLSTCAQFNTPVAMEIKEWFRKNFIILSGLDNSTLLYTAQRYKYDANLRRLIVEFMKSIDLGINDIRVRDNEDGQSLRDILPNPGADVLSITMKQDTPKHNLEILSEHKRYQDDEFKELVLTSFGIESMGSKKIFALLGPWFDTILNGGVLMIDEFGNSMHTKLALELIKVFQSRINKCAQLVITTHDTNLLRGEILRRDQIWFTEKDNLGVSDLYSLVEYKINQSMSVRNDSTFNKDYLMGKYGAIPYLGNIDKFISDFCSDGKV